MQSSIPILPECFLPKYYQWINCYAFVGLNPRLAASYLYVMNPSTAKYIIILGIIITVTGIILYFFHDKFNWFGRLPGDIRIEKQNFRLYFPITTMILISLLLTLLINIFKRL